MKFAITIGGSSQPALLNALDEARNALADGRCHLNAAGCVEVTMRPVNDETEAEFRRQYEAAHPRPAAAWAK